MSDGPFSSYGSWLEETYGCRVYRIGVDGLFSCPNRNPDGSGGCIYCDGTGSKAAYLRPEGKLAHSDAFDASASTVVLWRRVPLEERIASIRSQILRGNAFVRRRYHAENVSLYFQAWTNTYGTVDELKAVYDAALDVMPFCELIVSTRPDQIDDEKAALLASYRNKVSRVWVELGLQSGNDATLSRIHRGHTVAQYLQAARLLHSYGLSVCTHVILGLPGEGFPEYLKTARVVSQADSEAVKIHNLDICGGTMLYDQFLQGEVAVASAARHLEATELFLRHIPPQMVVERFVCETPSHRLAAPRQFISKNAFVDALRAKMEEDHTVQGDCCG
ncbi:MAG: TIGR01212 family radical SAM protein [Sphaerochaeta sp.]|nr:TIGR01212 family radical SAM protein [Sphaerochaeta sp.]MCH3919009.1 TIGR01212 family radical SAM protein [Sphaerochaeta sp.]MCI2044913.1 TIGR01212 family radical SAM protein [Sphaerochaeta sp.]MCI2075780.1 TIGR01212 family radical SAM protein [Sphaerochaeta sp.]MCI2096447.1 TIGR01212 family radical SAM protein [Sphaerochaeta sp.]